MLIYLRRKQRLEIERPLRKASMSIFKNEKFSKKKERKTRKIIRKKRMKMKNFVLNLLENILK